MYLRTKMSPRVAEQARKWVESALQSPGLYQHLGAEVLQCITCISTCLIASLRATLITLTRNSRLLACMVYKYN